MKKILVIGSPGAGKSTLSKRLSKILKIEVLHLDRVYHIDNKTQISRSELKDIIEKFVQNNKSFIIDGNYLGTLEFRMQFSDTVILLDIDKEICLENVIKRTEEKLPRTDIAPGFDNTIIDEEFIDYVKNFESDILPKIYDLLGKHSELNKIMLRNNDEIEEFLLSL